MGKVKYTTAEINSLLDKVSARLRGSGTDDIDAMISDIKDQLRDKADSEITTEAISGLTRSIGAANGIAPLGPDRRVPAGNTGLAAINVQEFSGFVDNAHITPGSAAGTPAIVFNRATSTFVAETHPGAVGGAIGTPPVYYPNWQGREDTDAGTPRANTVYIDITADIPYRWDGEELVPIVPPLGEEEGAAFPGLEGKELKQDLQTLRTMYGAVRTALDRRHPLLSASEDIVPVEHVDPETHNTTHYLSLTDRAKQRLFDDLFTAAAGKFGTVDHTHVNADGTPSPYYLNGLWLTYEEAVAVYQAGAIDTTAIEKRYFMHKIRTNLPPAIGGQCDGETATLFTCLHICDSSDIEVLNLTALSDGLHRRFRLSPNNKQGTDRIFGGPKLREVMGEISLYGTEWSRWVIFGGCPELETIHLLLVHNDMDMQLLPKISAASLRYMIEHSSGAANTVKMGMRPKLDVPVITFTVHADVYAKLTAHLRPEEEGYGDRDTDWDGLLDLAATHKITFASA